jgi:hypothetical protein
MGPALAFFAPLLGKCFVATLAAGTVDRHCFAAIYGGAHVRDTHFVIVGTKPVYSGETIYSESGAGLEFTYVNSTGGVGHGTVAVKRPAATFLGMMKGEPEAAPQPINVTWVINAGGYDVINEGKPAVHFTLSR